MFDKDDIQEAVFEDEYTIRTSCRKIEYVHDYNLAVRFHFISATLQLTSIPNP